MKISDIIACLEAVAPLRYQESWDNSGLQTGNPDARCTGVMVCLDATPAIIEQAVASGCNMVLSHHPRIFRGVKTLVEDQTQVQSTLVAAIRHEVALYCCHTPIDSAPGVGISARMAAMLGMTGCRILVPERDPAGGPDYGLGIIGDFAGTGIDFDDLVARIKEAFDAPVVRSNVDNPFERAVPVKRLALCSGSASEFIDTAIAQGADAYLTSDTRYHDFADTNSGRVKKHIRLLDIGHYESEHIVKDIFADILQPTGIKIVKAKENNPIIYF